MILSLSHSLTIFTVTINDVMNLYFMEYTNLEVFGLFILLAVILVYQRCILFTFSYTRNCKTAAKLENVLQQTQHKQVWNAL